MVSSFDARSEARDLKKSLQKISSFWTLDQGSETLRSLSLFTSPLDRLVSSELDSG